jgi:galactose mutarotase-like enzyme
VADDWVTLTSDHLTARINPFGAELSSLTDADGRELMTNADPAYWTGRAPILFPVVGRPSGDVIRVDGRTYPMKQHGFARRRLFAVEERAGHVAFTLADDHETRAQYPFAFRLTLAFSIEGASLLIAAEVANPGDVPLPASFGFHPAFAWPLPYGRPRADHRIVFDQDEPGDLRAIAPDATIAPTRRPSPLQGRTLALCDDLFAHDALVWDPVVSQSITYGAADGPSLRVDFPDTPALGIWTKPGAAYVCVEPWHGIADPHGYTAEFRDKPGVFQVAPGATKRIAMRITLIA